MPNYDGGKYFLSVMAPVRNGSTFDGTSSPHSFLHQLREALQALPTAEQTVASMNSGKNAPFARSLRTHFARFSVIDDVVYNGRTKENALVAAAITKTDPTTPQPVDQLTTAYLFFGADFDAREEEADKGLASYLTTLWQDMGEELRRVFSNCVGFEKVTDAAGFVDYITQCQIETTMPFNDYWTVPLPITPLSLTGQTIAAAIAGVAIAGALLGGLIYLLALFINAFHILPSWLHWALALGGETGSTILLFSFLGGVALLVATAWSAYRALITHGEKPWPAAPDSTLPDILKGLYLRQQLIPFAIDMQGADPKTLYDAFGAFAAAHKPADLQSPTQPPGVIQISPLRSPAP